MLVAREKLASLAPPSSNIKDERQKEAMQRYSVAAYHWSPDSKKLLFDSLGQLWLYNLDNGTAVQVTSSNDASVDPKFSPDGSRIAYVRKHNLYARDVNGGREDALTHDDDSNLLNGEVDCLKKSSTPVVTISGRPTVSNRLPADEREAGARLSHHRLDSCALYRR